MESVIIETITQVLTALLLMLINVGGAWLIARIGKYMQFRQTADGISQLRDAAAVTAGELQQTVVENLKAMAKDHKLTETQIQQLREDVYIKSVEKMSPAVMSLLEAAGIDTVAIIQGVTEDWVHKVNGSRTVVYTSEDAG